MKKMIAPLWLISLVATAALTYWIATDRMVKKQDESQKTEDVAKAVKQYFADHPEDVYAAVIAGMRKQKLAEEAEKRKLVMSKRDELENDPMTPYAGNPNGDVKIVMFTDYNCGYCRRNAPVIKSILSKDKNIKFVTKEYPILGPGSVMAARAAIAVFAIDKSKYFDFYEKLFATEIGSQQDIIDVATAVGIPRARLIEEMKKPANTEALRKIHKLGRELGINGTPAFVINGHLYTGALSERQMLDIIKQVREKEKS